jgi:CDP-glycerol glycerophosphotransferase
MKISVIIPHYRGKAYLKDALESLKLQEYPDIEVLLIKDGCDEDLEDLLEEYRILNIRLFDTGAKPGKPKGVPVARNIGLKNQSGDYVFFLDSDDYLSDGYFNALMDMAEKYPEVMIRSRKKKTYFKREGQLLREEQKRQLLEQQAESSETDDDDAENPEDTNEGDELDEMSEDIEAVQEKYKFGSATVLGTLIPQKFIDTVFDEKYRYYSDLPFMAKICRNVPVLSCKEVRYYKRTHNDAIRMPSLLQEEVEGKSLEFLNSLNDAWKYAGEGPKYTPVLTSEYALSRPNFNPNLSYIETYTLNYVLRKLTKGKHPVGLTKWTDKEIGAFTPFFEKIPAAKIKRYNFWKRKIIKKIAAGNITGARKTANLYSMKRKKRGLLGTPMQWKWNIYKRIFRKKPVRKDIVLFESFLGRSYGDSPRYIYEYLVKLQSEGRLSKETNIPDNATFIWMIDNKAAKIPGKHKQVKFNSLKYFYYVARCSVWVTNMRQPSWYVKREGVTLLECWHGTPLKRLVFDMEDV